MGPNWTTNTGVEILKCFKPKKLGRGRRNQRGQGRVLDYHAKERTRASEVKLERFKPPSTQHSYHQQEELMRVTRANAESVRSKWPEIGCKTADEDVVSVT